MSGLPETHRWKAPGVWIPRTKPGCRFTAGPWACDLAEGHEGGHRNSQGDPMPDRPDILSAEQVQAIWERADRYGRSATIPFNAGEIADLARSHERLREERDIAREQRDNHVQRLLDERKESERLREQRDEAERARDTYKDEATIWHDRAQDYLARLERVTAAVWHVVNDSPGTPNSVKEYLRKALAAAEEPAE